jgi:hypothetical protein
MSGLSGVGQSPSSVQFRTPPDVSEGQVGDGSNAKIPSLRLRTIVLKTLLVISALGILFDAFASISILTVFQNATNFGNSWELVNDQLVQSVIAIRRLGLISLLIFIVTGLAVLMWIHRANRVCRALGALGMLHSPSWAVASYFVPIINLFTPYMAMKEIWKASGNPLDWYDELPSPDIPTWWALWIFSNFLALLEFKLLSSSLSAQFSGDASMFLHMAVFVSVFAGIINLLLILVFFFIVASIQNRINRWAN